MDTYDQSEREQIEAIKKWWKDNGTSVIVGIVLGLGIIFGWRGWQGYLQQQANTASGTYERMLLAFEQNYEPQGRQEASVLMSEYNKTTYASLAALYLAKKDFEAGNIEASHMNLKWMIEQNVMPELTQVARLRQARLYLAENKTTEAKNALSGIKGEQFKASLSELKGDIAVFENDLESARKNYQVALESETLSSGQRTLLQMKLDDLGAKEPEFALSQKPKSALGSPVTTQDNMAVIDQPIVTEITQDVQPIAPIEPVNTLATPSTQQDNESSITATEIDRQSALEIKSITPVSPVLQYDKHVAHVSMISVPEMQLAAVSNLIPQTPITMTPRELQDNPSNLPVNTWVISSRAKPATVPMQLADLTPIMIQDDGIEQLIYSTYTREVAGQSHSLNTSLLEAKQESVQLPKQSELVTAQAKLGKSVVAITILEQNTRAAMPIFSALNQEVVIINQENKTFTVTPTVIQDSMLVMPLHSEQI